MTKETRQELFDYLHKTFGLKMLDKVDMQVIEDIIVKDYRSVLEGLICTEVNKRSKYHTKEDKLKSSEMWNKATDLLIKAQT